MEDIYIHIHTHQGLGVAGWRSPSALYLTLTQTLSPFPNPNPLPNPTTKGVARWRSPSPASPAAGFGRAMTKSASAGARPQWRPPPSPMQRWEKHGESPKSYIRSLHQPPSAPVDDEPCNPAPALLSNDRKPAAAVVAMVHSTETHYPVCPCVCTGPYIYMYALVLSTEARAQCARISQFPTNAFSAYSVRLRRWGMLSAPTPAGSTRDIS